MKKIYLYLSVALVAVMFSNCKSDEEFDNKVFINSTAKKSDLIIKGNTTSISKTIQVALAKPAESDLTVNYYVDRNLVETYNASFNDKAKILPDTCYTLGDKQVTINAGSIKSKETQIIFNKLSGLSRDTVYVLPVSINTADIDILASAKNYYYVLKAGALINVVADIEKNYCSVNWIKADVVNNLSQLTMEALIRVRNFDKLISTVMGIEGKFLIRIGDAGFPSNQIQIATSSGNFPSADSNKGLPTNKWVHVALTYDSTTGEMIVYVNGKEQSRGVKKLGKVNLGTNTFFIGRSYDDARYLAGNISECRIWNVVRTQSEIENNPYFVDPTTQGLVSYWKFDDQSALKIKDYTSNGNDATANKTLLWTSVSLPEK